MFDLEQSIAEWRKQMLVAGIKTPMPLDELENHLREEIERWMGSGSGVKQSFEFAVQQIGQINALKTEFEKAGRTNRTPFWARDLFPVSISPARKQQQLLFFLRAVGIAYCTFAIFGILKDEMNLIGRMLEFVALALTVLSVCGWGFVGKILPAYRSSRIATALFVTCNILGLLWLEIFANFVLPHFDPTQGQLVLMILWAMVPCAALFGFSYEMAKHDDNQRPASSH